MVQATTIDAFFTATPASVDQIPARPPTPPRESPRSASTKAKRSSLQKTSSAVITGEDIDTAGVLSSREVSPPSSSAESNPDKPKKKRVEWSPWTTYHKPESGPNTPTAPIRLPPSSSIDRKSLKSILKPFNSPIPLRSTPLSLFDKVIAAHTHDSFATMLESVIQALDSSERSTKLDTYITFCNTLKAYDDIPDMRAMEEKMSQLCGFIKQDLNAVLQEGGNADSQLIQQAIKLLTILTWTPQLVGAMDDQNASFFLMQAIQKIEDIHTPKLIVNHYLHFLAQQKFPPRIVTAEKCNRIISALETIEDRVTGKSIIKERIDIYYKLLSQSRPTMLARVSDWMENLLGGLLNSVTEVRNRALICAMEAAKTLGTEKSVSRALTDIFRREVNGKRMFDSIKERLDLFVKERDGSFVARMWAVILLLTRSVGDHWEFFNSWLRVIESCFNVSEKAAKVEAQAAWSKLIYAMNIGPHTSRKLLELLCKPLEQYLDPRNAISNTKNPRKAAMINVSVMLYYGFRPNAPAKQLSEIWDVVVVGLVEKLALAAMSSKEEVSEACSILSALFDGSTQKIWNEGRVLSGPPMQPDDIPRLEPKWVRANCGLVLKTVEVALQKASWHGVEASEEAQLLWKRFTKTLADAGSKEIRISAELVETVAHIVNLFQRLWSVGPSSLNTTDNSSMSFVKRYNFLVLTALESLGTLCFTEKKLSHIDNKFVPASTPTHRHSPNGSIPRPAMLHIFNLFLQPPRDVPVNDEYYECVRAILAKCCTRQDSRRKKINLFAQCATILAPQDAQPLDLGLWQILAELIAKSFPVSPREKTLSSSLPDEGEFRDVVKVLEWAYRFEIPGWEQLFNELASTAQNEQGEAFVAASVIEPLAGVLQQPKAEWDIIRLRRVKILVDKANYPRTRNSGSYNLASRKLSSSDVYDKLYDLVNIFLRLSYKSVGAEEVLADSVSLLISTGELVSRCPSASLPIILKRIQEGVGLWIKDTAFAVKTRDENAVKVLTTWSKFVDALERLPRHDSLMLSNLEILIASGLLSRRKAIVNSTIKLWNSTFGRQQNLGYPETLRKCLKTLRPVADLSLPTFPEDTDDESLSMPPQFSESQDLLEDVAREKEIWSSPTPSRPVTSYDVRARTASPSIIKDTPWNSLASRDRHSRTPANAQKTNPRRLKHMDSLLEFEEIKPSNEAQEMDSQVLTENQREVKERQKEQAAVFLDFKSEKFHRQNKNTSKQSSETGYKDPEKDYLRDSTLTMPSPTRTSRRTGGRRKSATPQPNLTLPVADPDAMVSFVSEMDIPSVVSTADEDPSAIIASPAPPPMALPPPSDDIDMSAPEDPQMAKEQSPEVLSDKDENFVDAPENHSYVDEDDDIPMQEPIPLKAISVRISHMKDPNPEEDHLLFSSAAVSHTDEKGSQSGKERTQDEDTSHRETSPEMQIMKEDLAAKSSPVITPKSGRGKRRSGWLHATVGTPTTKESPQTPQPGVLGAIAVTQNTRTSKSQGKAKSSVSPEKQRQGAGVTKNTKSSTPVRKVSPPRTRSSAKKQMMAALPNASKSRKRKNVATDEDSTQEGNVIAVEAIFSPTPNRRSVNPPPKKRLRSFKNSQSDEDPPEVSFVQETQLSPLSSGQEWGTAVGPTPGYRVESMLTNSEVNVTHQTISQTEDILEAESASVVAAPAKPGRGKPNRKSVASRRRSKRMQKAQEPEMEHQASAAEAQEGTPKIDPEVKVAEASVEEPASEAQAMPEGQTCKGVLLQLQRALEHLDKMDLDASECHEAENAIFEAFARLRQRRQAFYQH